MITKLMKRFVTWLELPSFRDSQSGAVNIANIMLLGIGMIFMGIGAFFIPVMIEGFEEARTAANVSQYTGLSSIIEIGPTIIVLGFIVAGGVVGFMGIKGLAD